MELNSDSFRIRNYELTQPEGFLKMWLVGGVPDQRLEYDGRPPEVINEDALFSEESLDTAVGKPLSFNHPPRPINNQNYKDFIQGAILQEFAKEPETGALVLSSIVYDSKLAQGIIKGDYKYVSASYKAQKELNNDGVLVQKSRQYNHFAILSPEYEPRAGKASRIIILNEDSEPATPPTTPPQDVVTPSESTPPQEPTIPTTPEPSPQEPQPQPQPQPTQPETPTPVTPEPVETEEKNSDSNPMTTPEEIANRVELLTQFKPVLDKAGKAIDYNADSKAIKKDILSIYYKENVMKQVNDNNLDGFWLGFITTNNDVKDVVGESTNPLTGVDNNDSFSGFESALEAQIKAFTERMEGVKK